MDIKFADYLDEVNQLLLRSGFITTGSNSREKYMRIGHERAIRQYSINHCPIVSKSKIIRQEMHIWPR